MLKLLPLSMLALLASGPLQAEQYLSDPFVITDIKYRSSKSAGGQRYDDCYDCLLIEGSASAECGDGFVIKGANSGDEEAKFLSSLIMMAYSSKQTVVLGREACQAWDGELKGLVNQAYLVNSYCSGDTGSGETNTDPVVPAQASSCNDLYQQNPSLPSGQYDITPASLNGASKAVYCDMTAEGGWTLVMRGTQGNYASGWFTSGAVNSSDSTALTGASFKFSDALINELVTIAYKVNSDGPLNQTRYFQSSCQYDHLVSADGDCANSYADLNWSGARLGLKFGGTYTTGLADFHRTSGDMYFATGDSRTHAWFVGHPDLGYKDSSGQHWSTGGTYSGTSNFWVWVK